MTSHSIRAVPSIHMVLRGQTIAVFVLQAETHFFLIKANTILAKGRQYHNPETREKNRSQPGATSKNHTIDRILKKRKKNTKPVLAFTSRIKLWSGAGEEKLTIEGGNRRTYQD